MLVNREIFYTISNRSRRDLRAMRILNYQKKNTVRRVSVVKSVWGNYHKLQDLFAARLLVKTGKLSLHIVLACHG